MPSRRSFLAMASLTLAGCTDDRSAGAGDGGGSGETPTDSATAEPATSESGTTASERATRTSAGTTSTAALDLREANVVDVEWTGEAGGDVTFDVTLYHDDSGEEGYANWWQVETTDGERLGRRELLHAHGTQRFTRSETMTIPADVRCVVVRGHDQTHGYGGRAAHVTLTDGTVRYVDQGPDRGSFADRSCSA